LDFCCISVATEHTCVIFDMQIETDHTTVTVAQSATFGKIQDGSDLTN